MKIKLHNIFIIFMIAGYIVMAPGTTFSQQNFVGEIINVNYGYEIAFTDLGNRYLKEGDIVKIYQGGEFIGHMTVVSSSSVISKLGSTSTESNYTQIDFNVIKVGNVVEQWKTVSDTKLIKNQHREERVKSPADDQMNNKPVDIDYSKKNKASTQVNDKAYQNLSKSIIELTAVNQDLKDKNKKLEDRFSEMENEIIKLNKQNQNLVKEVHEKTVKADAIVAKDIDKIEKISELNQKIKFLKAKLLKMAEIMDKR